jgi:hypothetical protein
MKPASLFLLHFTMAQDTGMLYHKIKIERSLHPLPRDRAAITIIFQVLNATVNHIPVPVATIIAT